MKKAISLVLITTLLSCNLYANKYSEGKRVYETKRVRNELVINGMLDDEPWSLVKWQSGFKQSQPNDGNKPSQETSFKILYSSLSILKISKFR